MKIAIKKTIKNSVSIAHTIDTVDGKNEILDLISKTLASQHTINGVPKKVDTEDEALMIIAIFDVLKRHRYVSLNELKMVFKLGLTGEFGEMSHFFNAKNVNLWLKSWWDKRREFVKQIAIEQAKLEDITPEISEADRQKLQKELLESFCEWIDKQSARYSEAKGGGLKFGFQDIDDHYSGGIWYDKLIAMGVLEPPLKKEKLQAVDAYKQRALLSKSRRSRSSHPISSSDKDIESSAINLAKFHFVKRLLLKWFENDENYRKLLL